MLHKIHYLLSQQHKMHDQPRNAGVTHCLTYLTSILFIMGCCLLCPLGLPSYSFGAELFPYQPPQQGSTAEQRRPTRPQLSSEDFASIGSIVEKARHLSPEEKNEFKANMQNRLDSAKERGQANQSEYYRQLLQRLE